MSPNWHASALAAVGLPTQVPEPWSETPFEDLLAVMAVDKKSRGNTLRFVVLDALARPSVLSGPDPAHLAAAYDVVRGAR